MTLQPQSLRIGNYVNCTYISEDYVNDEFIEEEKTIIGKVVKLNGEKDEDYAIWVECEGNVTDFERIEGIPLTEDILLEFNAHRMEIERPHHIIIHDRFRLVWKASYNYWYVIDDISLTYLTKIEFLHEYQNFWQSLQGTELTHKL